MFKRKTFIVLVLLLFTFILVNRVKAESAYFYWEKVDIDVPINADINDYKNDYILHFYVDGIESTDYAILMGVEYTTLTSVVTKKAGTYPVKYKAFNKKYNVSSTETIYFHVYDEEKPLITILNDNYELEVFDKPDYSNLYRVTDNNTIPSDIKVSFDESKVLFDKLGVYQVKITAVDNSNLESNAYFNITIKDTTKPTITLLKELKLSYSDDFDIKDYFDISDNYNTYDELLIECSNITSDAIGAQYLILTVSDKSGNINSFEGKIEIYDGYCPEIILKEEKHIVDIKNISMLDYNYFYNLVESITDDFSISSSLEIDYSSIEEKIGSYDVIYTIKDDYGNKTSELLKVQIKESTGPIIKTKECRLIRNSSYDLSRYYQITDDYDDNLFVERIYDDIDITKEGNYKVILRAYNSSGNMTVKELDVKVINTINTFNYKTIVFDILLLGIVNGFFVYYSVRKSKLN